MGAGHGAAGRALPISWHLAALCGGVALPLLVLACVYLGIGAMTERARLEDAGRETANDVALLLDREIGGLIATLQAIAIAPALQQDDLRAFYDFAGAVRATQGYNVVLRGMDGRQLVNTRQPWSTPLPHPRLLSSDELAIASGRPQVSPLFTGAVAQTPLFMVSMPVMKNGAPAYLLNLSLPVDRIAKLIAAKPLPQHWWITVIDQNGVILARTANPDYVGTKVVPAASEAMSKPVNSVYMRSPEGISNFASFYRTSLSGWTVGVAVPEAVLLQPVYESLIWMGLLFATALGLSLLLAYGYGRVIAGSVAALAKTAAALGRGGTVAALPSPVREVRAVADSLALAGREIQSRGWERDRLLEALGQTQSVIRGLDGIIRFWGPGAQSLYGWPAAEAVGRNKFDLLASRLPAPLAEINAALLATGVWDGEVRQRARDGREMVVSSHWVLRRAADGDEPSVVETNVDLTRQKRAEEALQAAKRQAEEANAVKSRFLAAASHDLRQPLQGLKLYLEVLSAKLAGSHAAVMQPIMQCVANLSQLLGDMLDLSKLEAGIVEVKPVAFRLDSMIDAVACTFGPTARQKGLRLRTVTTSAVALTDPALFERILANFVANAVRYTERGGVLIGCRRRGGRLWLEVWDSGIGIPESQIDEIFDEWVQVGNPERGMDKGSGLGLSIVRKTATLLGVEIRVASRAGRGSMFAVEVPEDRTNPHE